jgi:hypothetical protein
MLQYLSAGTLSSKASRPTATASEASRPTAKASSITAKACNKLKRPPPSRPPSPPPAQKTYAIDLAFRYVGNECPNEADLHQYVEQLIVAVDPSANTIVTSSCVQNNSAVPYTPASSLLLTQLNASNAAVPVGLNAIIPNLAKKPKRGGAIFAKAVPVYCTPVFLSQVHQVQISIRLAVPSITQARANTTPPIGRASRYKPPPPMRVKRGVAKHTPPPPKKAVAPSSYTTTITASSLVKLTQADIGLQPFLDGIRSLCLVQVTAAAGAYVSNGIDTTTGLGLGPCTATLQLPVMPPAVACAPPSPPPLPPR